MKYAKNIDALELIYKMLLPSIINIFIFQDIYWF